MIFRRSPVKPTDRTRLVQSVPQGPVFSYHASRQARASGTDAARHIVRADDIIEQRKIAIKKRIGGGPLAVSAGIMLCLVAVYMVQLGGPVQVVPVGITSSQEKGVFLNDSKVYESAAKAQFDAFLNRNKITVNSAAIAAGIKKQFPEIQEVSVSLPLIGNRPTVYIQPVTPKIILLAETGGMYLLDSNGRVITTANQVADLAHLQLPVVTDQSKVAVEVGRVVLPEGVVSFITEVVGQLKTTNSVISALTLPPGTNELHVRLEGAGYIVKYSLHGNAREASGMYIAVKQKIESRELVVKEYVDVRVANRVYYR